MSAGPFVALVLCVVSVVADGRLSSTALVAAVVVMAVHSAARRPPAPGSMSLLRAKPGTTVVTDDDSRWVVASVSRSAGPHAPERMTIDLTRTNTTPKEN